VLLWSPLKDGDNSSASPRDREGQRCMKVHCSPGARADGWRERPPDTAPRGSAPARGVVQQQAQWLSSVPGPFLVAPGEAPEPV